MRRATVKLTEPLSASMPRFPKDWQIDGEGKRVSIELRTKDFLDALDLFREIGVVAEDLEHHPDLHLEQWNRVRIESYSHDVGHLTERDERLVARLDEILRRRAAEQEEGKDPSRS